MVKLKMAVFAVLALAVISVSASAQATVPDGKIVVINTTEFPSKIGELRQKYEQVDNQFKGDYTKLEGLAKQIQTLENEINTQKQVLTQDKLREKGDQYEDLKRRFNRDKEDLQAAVDKAIETATKPVRDKLYQSLNNYATKNGIVMIINLAGAAQTGTLAFWDPKSDITADFMTEYNKANPVPTSAAPATNPPAAQPPATKPKQP
jgi:Skp family chaperone for outer membrane proteins